MQFFSLKFIYLVFRMFIYFGSFKKKKAKYSLILFAVYIMRGQSKDEDNVIRVF